MKLFSVRPRPLAQRVLHFVFWVPLVAVVAVLMWLADRGRND